MAVAVLGDQYLRCDPILQFMSRLESPRRCEMIRGLADRLREPTVNRRLIRGSRPGSPLGMRRPAVVALLVCPAFYLQ
jgi:hypothetical protein